MQTTGSAGAYSMLYFDPPEDWQLIVDYALNGGPKPSYERAQTIFDQYLENARFENCQEDMSCHPYFQREGDFEIPAIGYDDLPRDSRRSLERLPSPISYRQADGFDIAYEEGFLPPVSMPGQPAEGHTRDHMQLRLQKGEFVSYTVREPGRYTVSATYCTSAPCEVRVSTEEGVVFSGELPAAQEQPNPENHPLFPKERAANILPEFVFGQASGKHIIRLEVTQGRASFGKIIIRKV